jgi:hypothetical protein
MTRTRAKRLAGAYVSGQNRRYADPGTFYERSRGRRASRRRVDCQLRFVDVDNTKYCAGVLAVTVEAHGQPDLGFYRGCRFKPHARPTNP